MGTINVLKSDIEETFYLFKSEFNETCTKQSDNFMDKITLKMIFELMKLK